MFNGLKGPFTIWTTTNMNRLLLRSSPRNQSQNAPSLLSSPSTTTVACFNNPNCTEANLWNAGISFTRRHGFWCAGEKDHLLERKPWRLFSSKNPKLKKAHPRVNIQSPLLNHTLKKLTRRLIPNIRFSRFCWWYYHDAPNDIYHTCRSQSI